MNNTLIDRCTVAYAEAWNERCKTLGPGGKTEWPDDAQRAGVRAVIEHLAAELTVMGQHDAARVLMNQLVAQVIPLRRDPEGAA